MCVHPSPRICFLTMFSLWPGMALPLSAVPPQVLEAMTSATSCDPEILEVELGKIVGRVSSSATGCREHDALSRVVDDGRECPKTGRIVGFALRARALCHAKELRKKEAGDDFNASIQLLKSLPGAHRELAAALADAGAHALSLGRLAEAGQRASESLKLLREHSISDAISSRNALITLAVIHTRRGHYRNASKIYQQILSDSQGTTGVYPLEPTLLAAVLNFAEVELIDDPEITRELLDPLLKRLTEAGSSYDGFRAWALIIDGRWHYIRENPIAAETSLASGIALAESSMHPDDLALAQFRAAAAEALLAYGRYELAERLFVAAIQTWDRLGVNGRYLRISLEGCAKILRKTKRKAEAKQIEARLRAMQESDEERYNRHTVDLSLIEPAEPGRSSLPSFPRRTHLLPLWELHPAK